MDDNVQYPLPKLNASQELTIERIMADLLHYNPPTSPGDSIGPDSPSSSLDSGDIVYEFIEHMEKGTCGV